MNNGYWTIIIPAVPYKFATEWHPIGPDNPRYVKEQNEKFQVISRGSFPDEGKAIEWGQEHLSGTPYSTKFFSMDV